MECLEANQSRGADPVGMVPPPTLAGGGGGGHHPRPSLRPVVKGPGPAAAAPAPPRLPPPPAARPPRRSRNLRGYGHHPVPQGWAFPWGCVLPLRSRGWRFFSLGVGPCKAPGPGFSFTSKSQTFDSLTSNTTPALPGSSRGGIPSAAMCAPNPSLFQTPQHLPSFVFRPHATYRCKPVRGNAYKPYNHIIEIESRRHALLEFWSPFVENTPLPPSVPSLWG